MTTQHRIEVGAKVCKENTQVNARSELCKADRCIHYYAVLARNGAHCMRKQGSSRPVYEIGDACSIHLHTVKSQIAAPHQPDSSTDYQHDSSSHWGM